MLVSKELEGEMKLPYEGKLFFLTTESMDFTDFTSSSQFPFPFPFHQASALNTPFHFTAMFSP